MRKVLSDSLIRSAKPPATGRLEIADLRCAGLALRVTSNGARSWCYRFRDPQSGRTTRATLGPYPTLGLSDARTAADALRGQVLRGVNPVHDKRREREEADTKTFAALSERYMTEHAQRRNRHRTIEIDERSLRLHVLPAWGDRPYESIGRRDVIELCEQLVVAGKPSLANRTQALISSIFSYAIDADLVTANPASRLRKRGVERRKTRVLSDDELRLFWRCAVLPPVSCAVGLALRLCLLTGLRAGEAAGLRRAEVENLDDPERGALTVRAERTKNGRAHYVPLAPLAVETLQEATALGNGMHVFTPRGGPIEGHVLAVAMRRLSVVLPDEPGADSWSDDPPTPHDLRRTAATRMAALGVPGEDVSAVLNHARADVTGRHYDHYSRAREKRVALASWAAALARIINAEQAAEVVSIWERAQ